MVRPLMTDTVFLAQKALPDGKQGVLATLLSPTICWIHSRRTRTAASAWPPI